MSSNAIAIVGMACRFPGGADSPDAYWTLLHDGVDVITEILQASNIRLQIVCVVGGGKGARLGEEVASWNRLADAIALALRTRPQEI